MNLPGRLGGNAPLAKWLNDLRAAVEAGTITSVDGGRFNIGPHGTQIIVDSRRGAKTEPENENLYRVGVHSNGIGQVVWSIAYDSTTHDVYAAGAIDYMSLTDKNGAVRNVRRNGIVTMTAAGNPKPEDWFLQKDADGFADGGGSCCAVTPISAGKFYAAGDFEFANGLLTGRPTFYGSAALLNTDGTVDDGFNPFDNGGGSGGDTALIAYGGRLHTGNGFAYDSDGTQYAFALPYPDIVGFLAAVFHESNLYVCYDTGSTAPNVRRINSDGTVNGAFSSGTGFNGTPQAIASSGSDLIIGGAFTTYDGGSVGRLIKTSSAGVIDVSFAPTFDNSVDVILVQSGGKIVVGGSFGTVNGEDRNCLCRLNADGSLDATWTTTADAGVTALCSGKDGDVWVGGGFTSIGGKDRTHIARLSVDGFTLGI